MGVKPSNFSKGDNMGLRGPKRSEKHKKVMELIKTKSASEISRILGISRERVRQIIYANGGYAEEYVVHPFGKHNQKRKHAS